VFLLARRVFPWCILVVALLIGRFRSNPCVEGCESGAAGVHGSLYSFDKKFFFVIYRRLLANAHPTCSIVPSSSLLFNAVPSCAQWLDDSNKAMFRVSCQFLPDAKGGSNTFESGNFSYGLLLGPTGGSDQFGLTIDPEITFDVRFSLLYFIAISAFLRNLIPLRVFAAHCHRL
jgi:hypothetical protein